MIICGVDRADGLEGREGTPTPESSRLVQSATGGVIFEELPDSPIIERAEQCTVTHRFRGEWNECLTRLDGLGRGTFLEDSVGNLYKVLSATVQHDRPGVGLLTVVMESLSFDTPWDQFDLAAVELGVNILKHPRYLFSLSGDDNQAIIRAVQNYMENPSPVGRNNYPQQIFDSFGDSAGSGSTGGVQHLKGTDMAKAAALEIIQKYWRNEETPYMVGFQITYSTFSWIAPKINPGGYIENPLSAVDFPLPPYFSRDGTIFDDIAIYNPQCYSSTGYSGGSPSISWLRKSDTYEHERTWFKTRHTWIGSPVGYWDPSFFAASHRPAATSDYLPLDPDAIPLPPEGE